MGERESERCKGKEKRRRKEGMNGQNLEQSENEIRWRESGRREEKSGKRIDEIEGK